MFNNPVAEATTFSKLCGRSHPTFAVFAAKSPRAENRSFCEPERICQSQKPKGTKFQGQQEKQSFYSFFVSPVAATNLWQTVIRFIRIRPQLVKTILKPCPIPLLGAKMPVPRQDVLRIFWIFGRFFSSLRPVLVQSFHALFAVSFGFMADFRPFCVSFHARILHAVRVKAEAEAAHPSDWLCSYDYICRVRKQHRHRVDIFFKQAPMLYSPRVKITHKERSFLRRSRILSLHKH